MGWKTTSGAGQGGNDTVNMATNNGGAGQTGYAPVGGLIPYNALEGTAPYCETESLVYMNNHSAQTASGLCLRMASGGGSANLNFYPSINQAQGNQLAVVVANGNYSTGTVISDATHSDAIPASGTLSMAVSFSGTSLTGQAIMSGGAFWQADQPGGVKIPLVSSINGYNYVGGAGTYAARWFGVTGQIYAYTAVGQAQVAMPTSGVWSNLQNNVSSAGGTSAMQYQLVSCVSPTFISGTTATLGNQIAVVAGNQANGVVEDATHTDAVPAGYLINYQQYSPSPYFSEFSVHIMSYGSVWTSTAPNVTPMTSVGATNTGSTGLQVGQIINTAPRFGNNGSTTENLAVLPTAGVFSGMTTSTTIATTGSPTFAFYNNGATGNQTGTIGSTPGVVSDATHTDAVAKGQTFAGSLSSAFSSSFTLASQSVAFTTPAPSSRVRLDNLSLLGVG